METVKLDFPDRDLFILKDGDWRGYRSRCCEKEPETVEWIRSFPEGSTLWDVGASVGSYSLIAVELGHYVVAFEPFYPSLGHLQQNLWLNDMDSDCIVLPYGLGKEQHSQTMYVSAVHPGAASHKMEPGLKFSQQIVIQSVDVIADSDFPKPNHVKIDVDGSELGVIDGGRTLWKQVDSIMVESEPGTIEDISLILAGAGLQRVDSWKRQGETKQKNYLFRRGGKS